MEKKKSGLSVFFWAPFTFIVTQIIGLGLAPRLIEAGIIEQPALIPIFPDITNKIWQPPLPFWTFLLMFFIVVFIFFGFYLFNQRSAIKTPRKKKSTNDDFNKLCYKIFFVILIIFSGFILCMAFREAMLFGYFSIFFTGILALAWFLLFSVWIHNIALMLIMATLGAALGLYYTPWGVILILIAVSIYDVIAVFGVGKLKSFMIWLVEKFMDCHFFPFLIFPLKHSDFKASLKEVKIGDKRFSILGGGDLFFPLFFAVSVFGFYGLMNSLMVVGFALIGLFAIELTLDYLKNGRNAIIVRFLWKLKLKVNPSREPREKGVALPALPPLSFFSILGFLISLWI